jgi:hypothetical protein
MAAVFPSSIVFCPFYAKINCPWLITPYTFPIVFCPKNAGFFDFDKIAS